MITFEGTKGREEVLSAVSSDRGVKGSEEMPMTCISPHVKEGRKEAKEPQRPLHT